MKLTALLLLPAGWIIVLAALLLLRLSIAQDGFVAAGLGVEAVGLVLLTRAHTTKEGNQ